MPANIEQLRAATDRGLTADKVAVSDPAAAPLGADEEAAGTPPGSAQVTDTLSRERAKAVPVLDGVHRKEREGRTLIYVAVGLAVLGTAALLLVTR